MTETLRIFLTAAITLIGGLLLLVSGELVKSLVIEPLRKYKEQAQQTLDRIDYYANRLTSPFPATPSLEVQEYIRNMNDQLRSAATQLSSKYASISLRPTLVALNMIPPAESIAKAHGALIYLHNSTLYTGAMNEAHNPNANHDMMNQVTSALNTRKRDLQPPENGPTIYL